MNPAPTVRLMLQAGRPHQWAKNSLLLLPALAAHLSLGVYLGVTLLAGFASFSFVASGLYLVNDIQDIPHDRLHPTKSLRPVAAGRLPVRRAAAVAAVLLVAAAGIASQLSPGFRWALAAYVGLSLSYSFVLKRRPVLDVIVLATLYATRVVAGAALVGVPLSRWFLAFSLFLFLSLALVKRVAELQALPDGYAGFVRGRSYRRSDIPVLAALGVSCAAACALVYCLYLTSDDVGRLYRHPDLLWAGLPMILYWQARVWLITNRGEMRDDPIDFALRDPESYGVLLLVLLTAVAAW